MFKVLKNIMRKIIKVIKSKQFLYTIGIALFVFGFMYVMNMDYYNQIFKKENYSSMDLKDEQGSLKGLYKEDVGAVGTRKDFSHSDKPLLNPILVPVVKGQTE